MRKKLINKQSKKRVDRKCLFCPVDDYDLLNVHRIIPGEEGGTYTKINTITTCSNCHNKIHSGKIKIIDKKYCTSGRYMINCFINGEEMWLEE